MTIKYADSVKVFDAIATGTFLDRLTGVGGIPRGVITEIFGTEGLGKTTVCLQSVAYAQKQGLKCLLADIEWCFDPIYSESLGVDNSKLGLIQEQYAELALEQIEEAVESKKWDLIILDAIGALTPRAELEKSLDGATVGAQAKLVARFCRKIVPLLRMNNVALVAINHQLIDLMTGKVLSSGGSKFSHHKALSIRLRNKFGANTIKQGDKKVGKVVLAEVWGKNKVGPTEGMQVEGHIIFGRGFSGEMSLLEDAIEKGVITKKGNTYYLGSEKLAIGLGKTRKMIEDDELLAERIKKVLQ